MNTQIDEVGLDNFHLLNVEPFAKKLLQDCCEVIIYSYSSLHFTEEDT